MSRKNEIGITERRRPTPDIAAPDVQLITIEALTFFSEHPEEAQRFFAWSGLDAMTLRSSAADSGFGLGLLDYLAENLITLERFCASVNRPPGDVMRLHERLKVRGLTSHDEL